MKLISLLSGNGFVMFNKELAHKVSVNGAIIFGQLCSSYESFSNKDMLTVRDGKEYFFLTADVLEEETALTYKQQLKATKELEDAGYIETKVMGVPSKKYFYITNKIEQELFEESSRSAQKEDLNISMDSDIEPPIYDSSYDQREYLGVTKELSKPLQKGSSIKKKNKKEKDKNIKDNFNCNFKESLLEENKDDFKQKPSEPIIAEKDHYVTEDEFRNLLTDECNNFYAQFAIGRWNKKQWNTLIGKFVNDTLISGRYKNVPRHKINGFAFKCLERIVDNSEYKHSDQFTEYQEVMKEITVERSTPSNLPPGFYNWLEDK